MESKTTLLVAGATVAAAVVGGLGWKTFKARNTRKEVTVQPAVEAVAKSVVKVDQEIVEKRKAELRAKLGVAPVIKQETVIHHEMTNEELVTHEDPVLAAIGRMNQDFSQFADEVKVVENTQGEMITSVSRMRVAEPEEKPSPEEKSTQLLTDLVYLSEGWELKANAPSFWKAFCRNIRREEAVSLTENDFENRPKELARGYHRASFYNMPGILHVTKGHISFVGHCDSDRFTGISSSASRFGGKGLNDLSAKQAKDFLNGR